MNNSTKWLINNPSAPLCVSLINYDNPTIDI